MLITGCAESRPGTTKEWGYFERYEQYPPKQVGQAGADVLGGMSQQILENGPTDDGGWRVVARNFQDTHITVLAEPSDGGSTRLRVKVSPGENEGLSQRVMDLVEQKLH